jgi:hypothetical protein
MTRDIRPGNTYRPHRYGSEMWKKQVFIALRQEADRVIGLSFYITDEYKHLNQEIRLESFRQDQELHAKVKNPYAIKAELFRQIFDGNVKNLDRETISGYTSTH